MILSTLEAGKEDGADAEFALLSASAYIWSGGHLYCLRLGNANGFALLSASAYIWPCGHLYCCASAIANGVCIALGFCVYLQDMKTVS